jgi:phosphoserine phosphatase RsbU/P
MVENIPENNYITGLSGELKSCMNKVERLSNCIAIGNLINSELSIGKLLTRIMETTKKTFLADSVSLLLRDEKTGDLTFQIAMGDVGDEIKEIFRLKKGQGIAGSVAQTGIPLNLKDVYDHPEFSSTYDKRTNYRTRAMLCVPLKIKGVTLGIIQVMNKLCSPFYFTQEEFEMLITIGSIVAVAIDTAKMHQTLLEKETLERDLALAKEVQESFLPQTLPNIKGYSFAALNQPALEIGGDFYNFFPLPNDKLGIVLGDVSGKGISASLFMARLTSDLQHYAQVCQTPSQLLEQVNELLCARAKRGMFVTLVYILLDLPKRQIQFSNGGHLFPVYIDQNGTRLLGCDASKGLPLGIIPGISYEQETFNLKQGSCLTVYTDGITEAKNESGKLFGMERLLRQIQQQPENPEILIRNIAAAVDRYALGQGRSDDLTLLSIGVEKNGRTH